MKTGEIEIAVISRKLLLGDSSVSRVLNDAVPDN
jgi:hypothetical protein